MRTTIKDFRKEERVVVAHTLNLENAGGITRDISASGMYVETEVLDVSYALQSRISFTMKLDCPWGELILKCNGEIIRIETRDSGIGLAVKITELVMELDS